MSTVTLPLLTGLIALTAVILVKYLNRVDVDTLVKWWRMWELRKMYNYMYAIGAFTREQYLRKLKELEDNG